MSAFHSALKAKHRSMVGVLVDARHVLCTPCAMRHEGDESSSNTPLFSENLGHYQQRCHDCRASLNPDVRDGWPELFSQTECEACVTHPVCARCRPSGKHHGPLVCIDPAACECGCAAMGVTAPPTEEREILRLPRGIFARFY